MHQVHSAEGRLVARAAYLLATMALTPNCLHAQEPRAEAHAPVVEKAQRLPGQHSAGEPTLAADALGQVLIAAIEQSEPSPYGTRIILWRSEDGGRTWPEPSYLHDSKELGKSQADPWLQSDGPGKFSIVYMGGSTSRPDL